MSTDCDTRVTFVSYKLLHLVISPALVYLFCDLLNQAKSLKSVFLLMKQCTIWLHDQFMMSRWKSATQSTTVTAPAHPVPASLYYILWDSVADL